MFTLVLLKQQRRLAEDRGRRGAGRWAPNLLSVFLHRSPVGGDLMSTLHDVRAARPRTRS